MNAKHTPTVVMMDSPEAATYRTDIKGWVSRDGFYYGENESTARYAGCTHRACERCGAAVEKHWLACDGCRALKDIDRFEKMPRQDWDGVSMLFSDRTGEYYNDLDAVFDAMAYMDEPVSLADMRLIICKPNRGSPLTDDYFSDDWPDDGDDGTLPDEVYAAMDAFNAAIAAMRPLSWSPGKFALDVNGPVVAAITKATGGARDER